MASRGVIRPAPAHIRTITTSGHITTVPNNIVVVDGGGGVGQVRNESGAPQPQPPSDAMPQLKAQQQRDFGGHDG